MLLNMIKTTPIGQAILPSDPAVAALIAQGQPQKAGGFKGKSPFRSPHQLYKTPQRLASQDGQSLRMSNQNFSASLVPTRHMTMMSKADF